MSDDDPIAATTENPEPRREAREAREAQIERRSRDWPRYVTHAHAPAPGEKAEARFKIFADNPLFSGTRAGVTFQAGVGFTDEEIRATACAELGCAWIDTRSGESWWPGKKPEPPDPATVW